MFYEISIEKYSYTNSNRVYENEPVADLPPILEEAIDKLVNERIFTPQQRPDTCTINVYSKGNWLPPHVDCCVST